MIGSYKDYLSKKRSRIKNEDFFLKNEVVVETFQGRTIVTFLKRRNQIKEGSSNVVFFKQAGDVCSVKKLKEEYKSFRK